MLMARFINRLIDRTIEGRKTDKHVNRLAGRYKYKQTHIARQPAS